MIAIIHPFNSSLRGGQEEEVQGMEEGREESEQQTYYLPKMRQTQLSRYELNRGSSNHSATVNSPGTTPLQGQGQLRYKWSPRERIYVSGRGQETAFGVVCPPSPGNSGRIW